MERYKEIEKSLVTDYHKAIWTKFVSAAKDYSLINPGDKIAVCISGGKDSMLMAKCFQELHRQQTYKNGKADFEVVYIVMDPGYNEKNRQKIIDNAKLLNIPIEIFDTNIFRAVEKIDDHPCYICARMRRGYLYNKAKDMGCNKIALGHHFDDVIETILMSMLYGAQVQTMMPKLHSTFHEGMELIRPLYYVKEEDIIDWRDNNGLEFIQCACRFTEAYTLSNNENGMSKRKEVKELIKKFRLTNKYIDKNIFRSVQNVCLDTLISYKQDGGTHHFLDDYDKKKKIDTNEE